MCTKFCKTGTVILAGKKIMLRNPRLGDANTALNFINSLVDENAKILANKKFTLKEERAYMRNQIQLVRKNKLHSICAFHKAEFIGNVSLGKGTLRQSHVGTIGISVKKEYRGIGLGTLLLGKAIAVAKKDKEIKVLTLGILPTNEIARKLYSKIGFRTVAKLPMRIFYKRKYIDEYIMDYPLKKS